MKYQQRLKEVADFLKPYQRIWENEIMLLYPDPLRDYKTEWIEELSKIRDPKEVIRLELKDYHGLIKSHSLIKFYEDVERLSLMPSPPQCEPFLETPLSFVHIIPKKEHEIRRLAPLINHFYQKYAIQKIVDIGGGVGHLAQSVSGQYGIKAISLDMDEVLQKKGREIQAKKAKQSQTLAEFQHVKVDPNNSLFKRLLDTDDMTIGLHTCGTLANYQLMTSAKSKIKAMINFGCCYHKMEDEKTSQNLSEFAQSLENKLTMNNFTLTLATRAHRKMSSKDYQLKFKVKFYRYAFHILLHDFYESKDLLTLGNSSPKLYEEKFSVYALEQFKRIGFTPKHSVQELDSFFENPLLQDLIWKMLSAGLIRNTLGRLLEVYLLLDRICYLQEQGYECELYEVFDEATSPRNLGIFAHLVN